MKEVLYSDSPRGGYSSDNSTRESAGGKIIVYRKTSAQLDVGIRAKRESVVALDVGDDNPRAGLVTLSHDGHVRDALCRVLIRDAAGQRHGRLLRPN